MGNMLSSKAINTGKWLGRLVLVALAVVLFENGVVGIPGSFHDQYEWLGADWVARIVASALALCAVLLAIGPVRVSAWCDHLLGNTSHTTTERDLVEFLREKQRESQPLAAWIAGGLAGGDYKTARSRVDTWSEPIAMRLLAYDTRLAELFDKDDQHYSSLQPGEALNRRLEQLRKVVAEVESRAKGQEFTPVATRNERFAEVAVACQKGRNLVMFASVASYQDSDAVPHEHVKELAPWTDELVEALAASGADAMQLDPVRRVESVKHRSIGLDYETDPVRARNDDLLWFIDTIEQKLAVTERVVQELRTRP